MRARYHETYCGGIRSLLRWLDEDTWVQASGEWAPPRRNSQPKSSPPHDDQTGDDSPGRKSGLVAAAVNRSVTRRAGRATANPFVSVGGTTAVSFAQGSLTDEQEDAHNAQEDDDVAADLHSHLAHPCPAPRRV